MHWNGARWSKVTAPGVLSASDVWIASPQSCSSLPCQTALYHWNGSTWGAPYHVPALGVGQVSRTPTSSIWDSLIARYP